MAQPITSECDKRDDDGYISDCGHRYQHELQQCDNVSCLCEICEDCGYAVNERNEAVLHHLK